MDASIQQGIPPLPYPHANLLVDRRRPSRPEGQSSFVPLLREAGHSEFTEFDTSPCLDDLQYQSAMDRDHDGSVIKGIIFGLMLSMPFWLVTAFVGVMILH